MKSNSFSDVLISPCFSNIEHRGDVDLTTNLAGLILSLPIISANMKTITGPSMVQTMYERGGLGILHRFCTVDENIEMYKECRLKNVPSEYIGVSIGVKEEEKERFLSLYNAGALL